MAKFEALYAYIDLHRDRITDIADQAGNLALVAVGLEEAEIARSRIHLVLVTADSIDPQLMAMNLVNDLKTRLNLDATVVGMTVRGLRDDKDTDGTMAQRATRGPAFLGDDWSQSAFVEDLINRNY